MQNIKNSFKLLQTLKKGWGERLIQNHNVFMIHTIFYKLFYKQKTFIQNVRKNGGGILYQRYYLFIQSYYSRYKITWKFAKKSGGSSIKNSLVIATKILKVLNYKGECLRDIISFPAKI